jgi:hypothetical protein
VPSRWRSTSKPTGRVATSKAAQKRPPPKGAPGWPGLGGQAPLAGGRGLAQTKWQLEARQGPACGQPDPKEGRSLAALPGRGPQMPVTTNPNLKRGSSSDGAGPAEPAGLGGSEKGEQPTRRDSDRALASYSEPPFVPAKREPHKTERPAKWPRWPGRQAPPGRPIMSTVRSGE